MKLGRINPIAIIFTIWFGLLLSGCDTDMYVDTSECRDDSAQTSCPIKGFEQNSDIVEKEVEKQ